ncbi:MAG: hypothetical protein K2P99_06595 [Burkholderiales bacterium]|nr:hypothetical protein [Burkholderiales bacterium]
MSKHRLKLFLLIILSGMSLSALGLDASSIQITGVSDMLSNGETLLKVAAKWGGITTVIGGALALGSGKMHTSFAQTICKILVVIGLLIAAFSYFGTKINGFAF